MRTSRFTVLLLVGALAACATLPPQIAKDEGKVLVQGVENAEHRVLIRTVDDSDVLWVKGYALGRDAWVASGPHEIGVMCVFLHDWGTRSLPGGTLSIDVKPGRTYRLGGAVSADGEHCDVTIQGNE